jgi:hypothetical protein
LTKALLALKSQAPDVFEEAVNAMLAYILDRMNAAGVAPADMEEIMQIDGVVQLTDH